MNKQTLHRVILAGAISALLGSAAQAQNPNYQPGDLVLGFQNPGGTTGGNQVVLVNLGDTATVFRNAGTSDTNLFDITNVGALLSSTFGSNWASETSLYMTAVGIWGTNTLQSTLQNGDPHRTLYLGKPRDAVGTLGVAESSAPGVANTTDATTASSNAFSVGNSLEQNSVLGTTALSNTLTSLDEQNPFINLASGQQGPAYAQFGGGLQFRFGPGPQFANFGGFGAVEAALDLYRMQTRNNIAGQFDQGGTILTGVYQGSIVLEANGDVSFLTSTVPEPSAALLFGLAACGFASRSRRRTVA